MRKIGICQFYGVESAPINGVEPEIREGKLVLEEGVEPSCPVKGAGF
jgi:hypothetical protein